MKLSEIIKKYREENNISQREFAKACGLSNSLISILEMGINPQTGKAMEPDMRTYRRIADGMGVTVESLFERIKSDIHEQVYVKNTVDQAIIEALHQRPNLRMLFNIQKDLDDSDLSAVLGMVKAIAKERGDDD